MPQVDILLSASNNIVDNLKYVDALYVIPQDTSKDRDPWIEHASLRKIVPWALPDINHYTRR